MSANLAQYTPLRALNQTANQALSLPERFTFPYYYTPHPLCEIAMTSGTIKLVVVEED